MNKRGQYEIQFNWIFVLVAGALILLLFSVIMLRGKESSEKTTNVYVSRNIRAVLSSAEVSTGTVNLIDIPKLLLEFSCEGYRVGDSNIENMRSISLFSPKKILSGNLVTWASDWSTPYRITNFLYMTTPEIRYILIGDLDLIRELNETLPERADYLNIDIYDSINDVEYDGLKKIRFVFFASDMEIPYEFSKLSDKDVTALKVIGDENTGSLEFFVKSGNNFQSTGMSDYLYLPSLIGAIFSDNIEQYACSMEKAFEKLKIVTSIYRKRNTELAIHSSSEGNGCEGHYHNTHINLILGAAEEFNLANIKAIVSAAAALDFQNRQAQRQSCSLIY